MTPLQHPTTEAKAYFDTLWQREYPKLLAGDIEPAQMANGAKVPLDYCISTIARLCHSDALARVAECVHQLQAALPTQYFYTANTFHMTLMGCTLRAPTREAFTPARIAAIQQVCQQVIPAYPQVTFELRGVGLVGNQAFIQVMPQNHNWEQFRADIADALIAIGEEPLAYPNKAPIHMNIMRITDVSDVAVIQHALTDLRDIDLGTWTVSNVELVLTDFVLSQLQVIEALPLR